MREYINIYHTIIDISKLENNKVYNNYVLSLLLQALHYKPHLKDDTLQYKDKLALTSLENNVDSHITDKILNRLTTHTIQNDLINNLQLAYTNHANRNTIRSSTKDLESLLQSDILFKYFNPNTIMKHLIKFGINKYEASSCHDGRHVTQDNIGIYVRNIVQAYTSSDIGNETKYRIFDLNTNGYIDPRIFFIAIDKKNNHITYHAFDPDLIDFEKNTHKLLKNNFLFSIRNDV